MGANFFRPLPTVTMTKMKKNQQKREKQQKNGQRQQRQQKKRRIQTLTLAIKLCAIRLLEADCQTDANAKGKCGQLLDMDVRKEFEMFFIVVTPGQRKPNKQRIRELRALRSNERGENGTSVMIQP
jgi:hypothetical protein